MCSPDAGKETNEATDLPWKSTSENKMAVLMWERLPCGRDRLLLALVSRFRSTGRRQNLTKNRQHFERSAPSGTRREGLRRQWAWSPREFLQRRGSHSCQEKVNRLKQEVTMRLEAHRISCKFWDSVKMQTRDITRYILKSQRQIYSCLSAWSWDALSWLALPKKHWLTRTNI